MAFVATIQALLILVSPFILVLLGRDIRMGVERLLVWQGLQCMAGEQEQDWELPNRSAFVLGLVAYLILVFMLKCIGAWWWLAALFPLAIPLRKRSRLWQCIAGFRLPPNLNFLIWFFVITALGISLFGTNAGIATPWKNNYGDLTFHVGMITSFVEGSNFPPEYHIFPGERLSYPFMMNLWTAAAWSLHPSWRMLSFVFAVQWLLLWSVIYYFLRGDKHWLLPWALLLGGGSMYAMVQQPDVYSWAILREGYPWTVFLTTIWVTQRTALLGVCVVFAAVDLFFCARKDEEGLISYDLLPLSLSALLLAFAPLCHTHMFLIGTLFVGGMICLDCVMTLVKRLIGLMDGTGPLRKQLEALVLFAIFLLPCFLALPWLTGKTGMLSYTMGWNVKGEDGYVFESLAMWAHNAGHVFCVFLLVWSITKRHREIFLLCLLFLFGNIVGMAKWDWDQIKIFIAVYALFLMVWTHSRSSLGAVAQALIAVPLILPGAYEGYKIFVQGPNFKVYDSTKLRQAADLKQATPASAIIASAPDHNSLVTLAGRRMFSGYDGTLHSHGIDYGKRRRLLRSIAKLPQCHAVLRIKGSGICPTHLLWTKAEHRFWKRKKPPSEGFRVTELEFLYEIIPQ